MALHPQKTQLFSGTIFENITAGIDNPTMEKVEIAAKISGCHEFIGRLPNGYDFVLSEHGRNLSEGQRQTIAIARAIIREPKILIMDESTSNLDNATESLINSSLSRLMKDKTVIIAAHKITTLNEMDKILVFKEGGIVEIGNHEELLKKKNGYYKKMWHHQSVELHDLESDDS